MRIPLIVVLVALLSPVAAPAQGFIESISPPVLEVGKTTRVTFAGKDFAPGLDVWSSLPNRHIDAKPVESHADRLVFDVTVKDKAPVGVCGLRVATRDGLTNAHLLFIDDLPVQPRGTSDNAMSLPPDVAVWGTLHEAAVDRYTITVKAGDAVGFEVVGNRLGKDCDPLVTIRDSSGKWIAERDNDLYFDVRFEHRFAVVGSYTIEVRDARFKGMEHNHYVLRVGRFPAGRVAVPAAVERGFWTQLTLPEIPASQFTAGASRIQPEGPFFAQLKRPEDRGSTWVPVVPVDSPITVAEEFDAARDNALSQAASGPVILASMGSPLKANPFLTLDRHVVVGRLQATPARVPGVLCGVLKTPGRADTFRFQLLKNQKIFVRGESKSLNSPVDLELAIIDRTGREQRRTGETNNEVNFDFTAQNAGDYGLVVRDVLHDSGTASTYRITIRETPFPPQLSADVEGLTIPQGSYQPIPITVVRNGYTGPIPLYLGNRPPGLKLVPDVIPDSVQSLVCRLEADTSAPVGVQSLQIFAECGKDIVLVRTQPLIDKKLQNVDLIPIALRDDQRRLPPSLADRFAVQITPPAPFTFELSEKEITLPRYQTAGIPIITTRVPGFDGPIRFDAKGGQLADKNEGRTRVYAEFPEATREKPGVNGVVVSKILSNLGKVRIDVIATGTQAGRTVSLTRTFDLDLTTAFKITAEPAKVALLPGETAKVKLAVTRVKSFDGPVTLHLQPMQGVKLPETVIVPNGKDSIEIDIAVSQDAQPRKQNLQLLATGDVSGYEEELRATPVEVEVKKVEPPKK